jgi:hypothetical protein
MFCCNHHANEFADSKATEAKMKMDRGNTGDPKQPPDIKCNPFPSFIELKHEGRSVLQPPAKFIKSLAKTLSLDHIGDVKDRKDRGRSARMRGMFYPAAWRINELAMEEDDEREDMVVHRLNMRIYSWTHFIRIGRISKEGVKATYVKKFEDLVLGEHDGINPEDSYFENCPFCLMKCRKKYGGAEHYRVLSKEKRCKNKTIKEAIRRVQRVMEIALGKLEPDVTKWIEHGPKCNRQGDLTNEDLRYPEELRTRFPILCAIGWLVDNVEDDRNLYTMGMRVGTLPRSLTLPPRTVGMNPEHSLLVKCVC